MSFYLRGALIELVPTMLIPIPNVIVFQFNPETMTHTCSQPEAASTAASDTAGTALAAHGMPGETFNFTLSMDAGDTIADGAVAAGLAQVSGIYSRLAALEMLMWPSSATTGKGGLLGTVTGAAATLARVGDKGRRVPSSSMPTVLFVWGPGRIVPVRVTTLTVTERLFDAQLSPTHAEAQIGLRALTPAELSDDVLAKVGRAAYFYSHGLREALAVANRINANESVVGMIAH